jgi:hypothetical protein
MKHCLLDPEMEQGLDGKFTVFSCEFDGGKRVRHAEPLRLGDDGKIMLFLCQSCQTQVNEFVMRPILTEAVKKAMHDNIIRDK